MRRPSDLLWDLLWDVVKLTDAIKISSSLLAETCSDEDSEKGVPAKG